MLSFNMITILSILHIRLLNYSPLSDEGIHLLEKGRVWVVEQWKRGRLGVCVCVVGDTLAYRLGGVVGGECEKAGRIHLGSLAVMGDI